MRAIVTEGVGAMSLIERPEPSAPGEGQVMVRPDAVGICGSDYHFFAGELSEEAGGSTFPRVQGHEVAGRITAVGPGAGPSWPSISRSRCSTVTSCGYCYPCRVARPNTCENFQLIGIHVDGGLQQQLAIVQEHVYPIHAAHPRPGRVPGAVQVRL